MTKMKTVKDYKSSDSGIIQYALREFVYVGYMDENCNFIDDEFQDGNGIGMQEYMCMNVLELLEKMSEQGHSGFSASILIHLFDKLSRFLPLTPLTGSDDEWMEITEEDGEKLFQNRRCPHIFKKGDRAYDIDGKVFIEENGSSYTSDESRVDITFPYTPKLEYFLVKSESEKEIISEKPE